MAATVEPMVFGRGVGVCLPSSDGADGDAGQVCDLVLGKAEQALDLEDAEALQTVPLPRIRSG
jgi:hypothetical protein